MPLSISIIESSLLAAGVGFQGPLYLLYCKALATSVVTWAVGQPQNVTVAGITSGSSGAGTVTGLMQFTPDVNLVLPSIQAAGFLGIQMPSLITATVVGLVTGLAGTAYTGTSAGVSTGTDISGVVLANPLTLSVILQAQLTAFLGAGALVPSFATGLAQGISLLFLTGVGVGVVAPTGFVIPVPSAGTSLGNLL